MSVRLADEHDNPVPVGSTGELLVRTERPWELTTGYVNRLEENARLWRNGWLHTGDLFRADQNGSYFFVDRAKDALRRRGENISSFEVEREVAAYPGVRECACVGVPSKFGDDEIKVFVVPSGKPIPPEDIIEFLEARMPKYMVPRYLEFVEALPKTPPCEL